MKFFDRIWSDIKSGENIDLYLTIIVAIGLVALNILGVAPQSTLTPITLAVLGLMAITLLGNRHRIESLSKQLDKSNDNFLLDDYPSGFKEEFENANELWLVGVSLSSTIKNNYQRLEQKLLRGDQIKVLLVHPGGPGVEMAVSRNYAQRDVEHKCNDIRNSLNFLCILKQVAPEKLEIRTIQNPLGYGAFVVNPQSASGVLYLENYPYRVVSGSLPKFVLRSSDGQWYDFYNKEINAMWNTADEWACNEGANKTYSGA